MGNEFVFQQLAMENVETLNAVFEGRVPGTRKIVATCPHCFNSLGREYPQLGGDYEVVHHTQLLGQLVEEGRLTPVTPVDRKVTYHDPCFLGRHNKVYTPPREILDSVQGLSTQEMHRCKDRGFCCGAGGARMWMEEKIGKRINVERTEEALELDPDVISTACPFCITMLSDALNTQEAERRGQGPRRGPRRQPDPAALDGPGRRPGHRAPAPRSATWPTTRPAPAPRPRSTARSLTAAAARPVLLQLRVTVPPDRTDRVRELFEDDPGTAHLAVLPGASVVPRRATWCWPTSPGSRRTASSARCASCTCTGTARSPSTSIDAAVSSAARTAEERAPGDAADAVVWEQVVRTTDADSALSVSYLAFLTIALLLAAIAIINDSAILTIGAMVLGPEFAPLAALAVAVVQRRPAGARRAAGHARRSASSSRSG